MILIASIYKDLLNSSEKGIKQLAVLIDPDKFRKDEPSGFFSRLPKEVTHIFVGGSSVELSKTEVTVKAVKSFTSLPVILFPGDHSQITDAADGILFLSLISGRNPEYLIEQQVLSVERLKCTSLEIIPTGYILIDGGIESAVERVSNTKPLSQSKINHIVNTALAGKFSGKKLIYLEAGSGAKVPVSAEIITAVKQAVDLPLIVGGGICTAEQLMLSYEAGADLVVIGTAFEEERF